MNEARYLWTTANEVSAVITRWLEQEEGKHFFSRLKQIDQLRLTKLRVWSWRHKISVYEILTLTLPYLRASLSTKDISKFKLGCSIAALTGRGNEKILVEALRQKYPGSEHRDIWREEERLVQIEREEEDARDGLPAKEKHIKGLLASDSAKDYIESYTKRVLKAREKMQALRGSSRRRRKAYRGNPFL